MTATKAAPTDYFGLCPECHRPGVRVDAGKNNWFVCEEHRVRWCEGYGLFTPQTEVIREMDGEAAADEWHRKNLALLAECREVEPFHCPPTLRQRLARLLWPARALALPR